ncbi:MAG: hypothetical protein DRJ37_01485 [Thermoprotei archaeon]|nr:MAG: hypothetical protein DRJ37_01485 [Thermoprotei archaeon]
MDKIHTVLFFLLLDPRLNPENMVEEASEENNVAECLVPVSPSVDLEVLPEDIIWSPPIPKAGEGVGFRVFVRNNGNVRAHDVTVTLTLTYNYVDDSGQCVEESVVLTSTQSFDLDSGMSRAVPVYLESGKWIWTIPAELCSDKVQVVAEVFSIEVDVNPGNNVASKMMSVVSYEGNLRLIGVTPAECPRDTIPLGYVLFRITVFRSGWVESRQTTLRIESVRKGGTSTLTELRISLASEEVDQEYAVILIAIAESPSLVGNHVQAVIINSQLLSETWTLVATVDPDNEIYETDEEDNSAAYRYSPELASADCLPDLTVYKSNIRVVATCSKTGPVLEVGGIVSNIGSGEVNSVSILVELPEIGGSSTVSVDLFGGSATFTVQIPLMKAEMESRVNVRVVVDPSNEIKESNEENNIVESLMDVSLADLAAEITNIYGKIGPGRVLLVDFKVTNLGNILEPEIGCGEIVVKMFDNVTEVWRQTTLEVEYYTWDSEGRQVWYGSLEIPLPIYSSKYIRCIKVEIEAGIFNLPELDLSNNRDWETVCPELAMPDLIPAVYISTLNGEIVEGESFDVSVYAVNLNPNYEFSGGVKVKFTMGPVVLEFPETEITVSYGETFVLSFTFSEDYWNTIEVSGERPTEIVVELETDVMELSKENNIYVYNLELLPDLKPISLEVCGCTGGYDDVLYIPGKCVFYLEVRNEGSFRAKNVDVEAWVVSQEGVDICSFGANSIEEIEAGESIIVSFEVETSLDNCPLESITSYVLEFRVDPENEVEEFNEDNNVYSWSFLCLYNLKPIVTASPSPILGINQPGEGLSGEFIVPVFEGLSLDIDVIDPDMGDYLVRVEVWLRGQGGDELWYQTWFEEGETRTFTTSISLADHIQSPGTYRLEVVAEDSRGATSSLQIILQAINIPVEVEYSVEYPLDLYSETFQHRVCKIYVALTNTWSESLHVRYSVVNLDEKLIQEMPWLTDPSPYNQYRAVGEVELSPEGQSTDTLWIPLSYFDPVTGWSPSFLASSTDNLYPLVFVVEAEVDGYWVKIAEYDLSFTYQTYRLVGCAIMQDENGDFFVTPGEGHTLDVEASTRRGERFLLEGIENAIEVYPFYTSGGEDLQVFWGTFGSNLRAEYTDNHYLVGSSVIFPADTRYGDYSGNVVLVYAILEVIDTETLASHTVITCNSLTIPIKQELILEFSYGEYEELPCQGYWISINYIAGPEETLSIYATCLEIAQLETLNWNP